MGTTQMSPRELVRAALRHEETEAVPYNFMFTPPASKALADYYGDDDLQGWLNCHLHLYGPAGKPLYAFPAKYGPTYTDEFGVVWTTSERDRGVPIGHPLAAGTLAGYTFPDPHRPQRWAQVAPRAAEYPHQYQVGVIGDLWERACFLCGLENLLVFLYTEPAFVHELLDRLCEYDLATLAGLLPHRPDAVFLSDDYGFQDRLMLAPEKWRAFVRPRLARLLSAAKAAGLVTMLHSCGNVTAIVPDLVELGLDILHPIQPEAVDVFKLKRDYGKHLTFCGGINTQQTLCRGTAAEVSAEVTQKALALGQGGGYILEPGITIQADVPLANMLALIDTARAFRRANVY